MCAGCGMGDHAVLPMIFRTTRLSSRSDRCLRTVGFSVVLVAGMRINAFFPVVFLRVHECTHASRFHLHQELVLGNCKHVPIRTMYVQRRMHV